MNFRVREATVDDCQDIARMSMELAEYEKVTDLVKIGQKDLEQDGFSDNPSFRAVIVEVPEDQKSKGGHVKIGFALYFYSYSSWKGRSVYLEDLYVMPEFRGQGIGKMLMSKVAELGLAVGCKQMNFIVLNCNKSALDFYSRQGSVDLTDKLGYHWMSCGGDALKKMADNEPVNS